MISIWYIFLKGKNPFQALAHSFQCFHVFSDPDQNLRDDNADEKCTWIWKILNSVCFHQEWNAERFIKSIKGSIELGMFFWWIIISSWKKPSSEFNDCKIWQILVSCKIQKFIIETYSTKKQNKTRCSGAETEE